VNSSILRIAANFLLLPLLLISLWVLYRGHNLPGGGFIGGLLAASAFALTTLAFGVAKAREKLRIDPLRLTVLGLGVAAVSSLVSLLAGKGFFTGLWLPTFSLPLLGTIHLGTPLVFDIGVYLAVVGFSLSVIFEMEELE
jgi:multicomponent Na+:H+ antiporter subunit B